MLLEIRTGKFLSLFLLPQRLHLTLFIHPHPIQHKLKILNLYYIWTNCYCCCSSVAQSCPTLPPHGPQHARLPCLSQPPGVCSNLCPFSQCCHPTILSFVVPFSSCLQYFTASGALLMSHIGVGYHFFQASFCLHSWSSIQGLSLILTWHCCGSSMIAICSFPSDILLICLPLRLICSVTFHKWESQNSVS